jgi:hypothetical protein
MRFGVPIPRAGGARCHVLSCLAAVRPAVMLSDDAVFGCVVGGAPGVSDQSAEQELSTIAPLPWVRICLSSNANSRPGRAVRMWTGTT